MADQPVGGRHAGRESRKEGEAFNAAALIDLGHAPGLKTVGPALTLEPYALAMPAEAYQLRDAVNRALEDLRGEGFFEQNGARWFVAAPAE